jgi:glycosyltransferase involved in cell wall biosynthesis
MANLEAMVAGVPIVSTAIGGALEVLGSAASWIPGDDEEALMVALQQVLTDLRFRTALVDRSLRRAESWPNVDRVADAYEQVYRLALG